MMTALIGATMFVFSAFSFWYLLPTNGRTHWLVEVPGLEAYVPAFIISGVALGLVMAMSPFF